MFDSLIKPCAYMRYGFSNCAEIHLTVAASFDLESTTLAKYIEG